MLKIIKILRGLFLKNAAYFLPFFLLTTACEEPKKGCTDIRATNFDVAAAQDDNTTCTFPKLVVQVAYIIGGNGLKDSSLLNTSAYKNALGQPFKILQAATYLSDFQLVTSDNKIFKTTDSIALYRTTDTIRALNSFAMIGRNNGFEFTIGTFEAVGKTFTKLRFNVGLTPEANQTDAVKMPSGHPLSIRPDSMYNRATKAYIFNKLLIAKGTNFGDTLSLNMTTLNAIELTKNLPTKEGANVTISLIINYLQLLNDVDLTKSKNLIEAQVVTNTSKAFSLK